MGRVEKHDGKAWRARAEECRAIADTFSNPETRAKMYAVAADYELLAERAEQECDAPPRSRPDLRLSRGREPVR